MIRGCSSSTAYSSSSAVAAEGDTGNSPSLTAGEAAESSTESSGRKLKEQPSDIQQVAAILARFKRSGTVLHDALKSNARLIECSRDLRRAEFPTELQQKLNRLFASTWIFLDPEYVAPTLDLLDNGVTLDGIRLLPDALRSWHIIAGPAYYDIVEGIIDNLDKDLRLTHKVKIRASTELRTPMPRDGASADQVGPAAEPRADDHEQGSTQNSGPVLLVQIDSDGEADPSGPGDADIQPGPPSYAPSLRSPDPAEYRLLRDKTFLHVRVPQSLPSVTSAGKRTWPLTKRSENRHSGWPVSKKARSEESCSSSAGTGNATVATQGYDSLSQSLGGFTDYFQSQEALSMPETIPETVSDVDIDTRQDP